jgi:hypothetical protein
MNGWLAYVREVLTELAAWLTSRRADEVAAWVRLVLTLVPVAVLLAAAFVR